MLQVKFSELSAEQKLAVQARLEVRRRIFTRLMGGKKIPSSVLLVGDRPGPTAPSDPTYHHTPFYSVKYCSGWLNALLEVNAVPEEQLAWINAYDRYNEPTTFDVLSRIPNDATVVLLGGWAATWYKQALNEGAAAHSVLKFPHPQFWKRFKSKKPYPLIEFLRTLGTST